MTKTAARLVVAALACLSTAEVARATPPADEPAAEPAPAPKPEPKPEEPMSLLTAGPQGRFIPQRELTTRWWCRGMVCVAQLPSEGDVCAGLDAVNKGPCHAREKAHVLRAFDDRQQSEIILVLTTPGICATQLRRWKRDPNLRNVSCEAQTPGAFFGVEVSDKD